MVSKGSIDSQVNSSPQEVVTRDIDRVPYDLSHWSHVTFDVGALQTISTVPVLAGDSFEFDFTGVFRLSPLRRIMYLDAVVDLFAFYVPHRHIYGSNWTDFISQGFDEGVTLGTDTMAASVLLQCVGQSVSAAAVLPRWLTRGYIQIWNNYFRDPTIAADVKADNVFTTLAAGDPVIDRGYPICNLKRMFNTGILSLLTTADYRLPLDTGEVNLYQLDALKGRLRTEQARDWFAVSRYRDILNYTWGSQVSIDADQRPELVMRSRTWLSGHDIDGTDDATLGDTTGKSAGVCRLQFPRKFFPEHGTLWIMFAVRFPPIYGFEVDYLVTKPEPTYAQIAGDPQIISKQEPVTLLASDVFHGNAGTDLGKVPYGQWYREKANVVHRDFLLLAGHPFINPASIVTRSGFVYVTPSNYDAMFKTLQLRHGQCMGFSAITAMRFISRPEDSIFAGTK